MPLLDSTDADLDAFDDVCMRLGGFDARIDAEWVDGYLTALAAGPRAVSIDEWLPRMAGDAFERAFADPPSAQAAQAALLARTRVLASHLDPEALRNASVVQGGQVLQAPQPAVAAGQVSGSAVIARWRLDFCPVSASTC